MQEQLKQVQLFQETFKRPVGTSPSLISEEAWTLRLGLMQEEVNEYEDACKAGDLVEVADALGDQLYILCGTIIEHGLQDKIVEIFNEIQRSNMSKLDENGEPILNGITTAYDESKSWGKVLKGINFTEPNIQQFL